MEMTESKQLGDCTPEMSEEMSTESPEDPDSTWANVPCTILESVYRSMTCCQRLRVSSVCRKWRQCLYTPSLWWDIHLDVINKREGNKAYFLSKMVHFARSVRIFWPAEYTRGEVRRPKQLDMHNKETLKVFFCAMENCKNLRTLILKLENPCAFSPDFSRPVQEHLSVVCQQNSRLTFVTFGCNSTIIPPNVIELLPEQAKINMSECHIARIKPAFSNSSLESVPVLGNNDFQNFSLFHNIRHLTIDWNNVSAGVIQGLSDAGSIPSSLIKLNIFVDSHYCSNQSHPSIEDWQKFALKHNQVKISLVFVRTFDGICNSLRFIQPPVFMIKVLECPFVDPDEFGKLINWFKDDIKALVHVGMWDNIELETGPMLWPSIAMCPNIHHLAFIGHFVLDEILLFIASHFVLKSFVVSKAHVMMLAEATHYLLPTSAGKYNQFRQEMTAVLQRQWEAITDVPLNGFYFAEGDDDDFYLQERSKQTAGDG